VSAVAEVAAAGAATAVATGLGALPVGSLDARAERLRPVLLGIAAGAMVVVSVLGLLVPALRDGSPGEVAGGVVAGVVFLLVVRRMLSARGRHDVRLAGRSARRAALVFIVLFAHSLPEGFAIGAAWASETEGLALFVLIAIAAQNVPEGTVTAIPLALAGAGRLRQFVAAVGTSLPQPVGAVAAFLLVEEIDGLLAASFAFAGGAMLALVVWDVAPDAWDRGGRMRASAGAAAGGAVMVVCALALDIG
jgi:zinc transporter, ZIP family